MYRAILTLILLWPGALLAAPVSYTDQPSSFDLELIEEVAAGHQYFGELTGWPHTWQFVVREPLDFSAAVSVPKATPQKPTIILIKEERRGVSEIDRIEGTRAEWTPARDQALGMTLLSAGEIAATLEAGVYRLQVNSPDNAGQYRLQVGDQSSGYGEQVVNTFKIHAYFGAGLLGALLAPVVYGPLVFGILLYGLWRWYSRTKPRTHA